MRGSRNSESAAQGLAKVATGTIGRINGKRSTDAGGDDAHALLAHAHSHILLRWPENSRPRTIMVRSLFPLVMGQLTLL